MHVLSTPNTARQVDDDPTADPIAVIEWPDDESTDASAGATGSGPDGLFGHLLGAYEQRGYAAGYRRAVSDVLTTLLATSEQFIHDHRPASPADLRGVVLAFADHLEQRLGPAAATAAGLVEGGLGI